MTATSGPLVLGPVVLGLCGKLPARGDFIRRHLARDFVEPWEAWWARALVQARARDAAWPEAWLFAPVWQFALAPGICGAAPIHGVVMPSVDAVGRYFPLTLAAFPFAGWDPVFLAAAEEAGRDAIATDVAPDDIVARMRLPPGGASVEGCRFGTEGGPRVTATEFCRDRLPSAGMLLGMLNDQWREDRA